MRSQPRRALRALAIAVLALPLRRPARGGRRPQPRPGPQPPPPDVYTCTAYGAGTICHAHPRRRTGRRQPASGATAPTDGSRSWTRLVASGLHPLVRPRRPHRRPPHHRHLPRRPVQQPADRRRGRLHPARPRHGALRHSRRSTVAPSRPPARSWRWPPGSGPRSSSAAGGSSPVTRSCRRPAGGPQRLLRGGQGRHRHAVRGPRRLTQLHPSTPRRRLRRRRILLPRWLQVCPIGH